MKSKYFITAMAGAMVLHAGATLALKPDQAPQYEIRLAGATAQDASISALIGELCVSGTLDTYYDAPTGTAGTNHRAYFCNIDSAKVPGLSASNPAVLIHKTSTTKTEAGNIGGSGIGVNPVLLKLPVDVMSINNGNCVAPITGESYWRCRINQPGDVTLQVPQAGASDVNPSLFRGPNTPNSVAPVDKEASEKLLKVVSGGAIVMGTPVTLELRNALQSAHVAAGNLKADCVGQETEECMPSLSKAQLKELFLGNTPNWADVKIGGRSLTEFAAPGSTTDSKVYICRRTNGSGTQSTINATILDAPCSAAANNPLETSNDNVGPVVKLNAGSGDVEKCLQDLNSGSNASGQNPNATKAWALGLQSTEKNATNTFAYRFIKVDGFAPTLENTAANKYPIWVEVTWQWLNTGGPTGDEATIIKKLATDSGKPTIIAKNNAKFKYTWGQGGFLAVAAEGWPVPPTFDVNNPVTPWTHQDPVTGVLDDCRAPVIYK